MASFWLLVQTTWKMQTHFDQLIMILLAWKRSLPADGLNFLCHRAISLSVGEKKLVFERWSRPSRSYPFWDCKDSATLQTELFKNSSKKPKNSQICSVSFCWKYATFAFLVFEVYNRTIYKERRFFPMMTKLAVSTFPSSPQAYQRLSEAIRNASAFSGARKTN